jgi:hypothetical protein
VAKATAVARTTRGERGGNFFGALAQLGERLICIQEVRSSILLGSTKFDQRRALICTEWVGSSGG